MDMTIENALKMAIDYETKVRNVYNQAAESVADAVGKRVYQALAKEEQGHLDYLQTKLDQLTSSGTISPEKIPSFLPPRSAIDEGVEKLKNSLAKSKSERIYDSELQMLEKAREVEIETSNFYKRMVEELPEEGQKLFAPFVAIEEGHLAIVQAELDHVTGSGFYFDIFEVNLEHYS